MAEPLINNLKQLASNVYPVGCYYKSNKSTNPSTLFGGTWENLYHDYEIIHLASQSIYDYWSSSTKTKIALVGAYGITLLQGIFLGRMDFNGYVRKVGCTAQITTGGENNVKIYLNDKLMCQGLTWSGNKFRIIPVSNLYTLEELGRVPVVGYTQTGINLYIENTGDNSCEIRDVTVHGYLVSKEKIYMWKRTA